MSFSDPNHNAADIVFYGAQELPLGELCDDDLLAALSAWQTRKVSTDPMPELLQIDRTRSFTVTYDGKSGNYWPTEPDNEIGEGLVRDFLFNDGICSIRDLTPRLYAAKFKVQVLEDVEYLLICPYPTSAGNVSGILVVCVNQHLISPVVAG